MYADPCFGGRALTGGALMLCWSLAAVSFAETAMKLVRNVFGGNNNCLVAHCQLSDSFISGSIVVLKVAIACSAGCHTPTQ
jgi:hypothetical protein